MLLFVFWKVLLCSEGDTVLGDDITIFSHTYPKLGVLLRAIFPAFQSKKPGGNKPKIIFWWVTRVDELLSETSLRFYIPFKIIDV